MRNVGNDPYYDYYNGIVKSMIILMIIISNEGMIHFIIMNIIIPATPSNPSIPCVKRTSKGGEQKKYSGDVMGGILICGHNGLIMAIEWFFLMGGE